MNHVRQAAGHLGARSAPADDHEVQCALVNQLGIAVGVFEQGQDARAQTLRIDKTVERKSIGTRSGGAKKIGLCTRGKHKEVALVVLTLFGAHTAGLRLDGVDLRQFDIDVGQLAKNLSQRKSDVARGKL